LSSDTQKYDVKDNECGFTAPGGNKSGNLNDILTEKIHQQRKILNQKLGIDVGGAAKLDTTHIFSDYDLIVSSTAEITQINQNQHECASTSNADVDSNVLGNLKRKLENVNEANIDQASIKQEEIINDIKKFKKSDSFIESANLNASETELNHVKSLELFTQWLLNKLFDSDWEIRHGAATSLREIIKGLVYSLMRYFKEEENSNVIKRELDKENLFLHLNWFQDCLVKILSVIALDRFADYVGDEAVAPVREVKKNSF
jgi:TATA-binding protein-associated factor